jgi:IMP dehydrogenase/GMP reductase
MVVQLSVPDEVYQTYVKYNKTNPHRAMAKQLEKFQTAHPGMRGVYVTGDELAKIQSIADRQVSTPKDLVDIVKSSLTIPVEGIGIELTKGQRERMAQEAQFFSQEPEAYAKQILTEAFRTRFGV